MAKSLTDDVMIVMIENVIPMLSDLSFVSARQGAGMLLSLLVQGLAVELVPYSPFLVVPLLRCMSDPDGSVRKTDSQFCCSCSLAATIKGCSFT
jgi:TATA-binding protein-associated factor